MLVGVVGHLEVRLEAGELLADGDKELVGGQNYNHIHIILASETYRVSPALQCRVMEPCMKTVPVP